MPAACAGCCTLGARGSVNKQSMTRARARVDLWNIEGPDA